MSKTFRRDKLLRLAKAGKLVAVGSYHYDEMSGVDQLKNELPVRVRKDYNDHKEGFVNLWEHDFTSSSGSARQKENGTVTLYVHSNCNYDFRIKE